VTIFQEQFDRHCDQGGRFTPNGADASSGELMAAWKRKGGLKAVFVTEAD
jgi:hypothetical protein